VADPLLFPDNAAAALRRLEERVRALESTNRLLSSAIKDGNLSVLSAAGTTQIVIGRQADGNYGILVGANQPVPALDVDNVNGISYPWIPIVFSNYEGFTITNPGFVTYVQTYVPAVSHKGLLVRVRCSSSVGTVGEVQLHAGSDTVSTSSAVRTIPSDSFFLDIDFWFLHGLVLGEDCGFSLNMRRSSGAGTLLISAPLFAYQVGPEHCSSTGAYVP
jgi:hypothetical protein